MSVVVNENIDTVDHYFYWFCKYLPQTHKNPGMRATFNYTFIIWSILTE